jgi:hypothetical protein
MPARRNFDEQLALALAAGLTVDEAAARIGVSKTAAFRRLRSPLIRRRVDQLRAEMVDRAVGTMAEGFVTAAATLRLLMRPSETSAIRLRAATALLDLGLKAAVVAQLEQRVAELESALKGNQPPCSTT